VLVLQTDLSCSYISPVAARLLGYPKLGYQEFDLLSFVHRDDRVAATSLFNATQEGSMETIEIRLRHFVGTYAWFEVGGTDLTGDPSINGILLNAREIGDRKMAEERLLHSEARFKALVQNSTDLVIVIEPNGAVGYASPSVEASLGMPLSLIQGLQMSEVFAENTLPLTDLLESQQPLIGWNSAAIEFGYRATSGDWRILETTLTDLRGEPAVGGLVFNARDITDRKQMNELLLHQATHDELTGLPNRRHLLDLLSQTLDRNGGTTTVSALLVDIDDFKDVNDSLGHSFGDRLLEAIAERLTGLVHSEVLDAGDIAARIGGDEFVVAFERAHGEKQTADICEQVLVALNTPFVIDGRELTVTASAGLAFDHDRSNSAELLLQNADTAMYKAKDLGKRQVVVFESYMHVATFDRLELRADLARAVAQEQFEAYYQPVVNLATQKIVGAEALVRWRHPERGMVGPGLFIPLAEESGLIAPIGEFMLSTACEDLCDWREEFGAAVEDFTVSVNLSVQQLHDRRIVGKVSDILEQTGLPAERLVLEVTESTLITETEMISSTMQQLRSFGTRLAIDDFGTGYSSLGYIQQFEFDVLKIDKSFVDDLDSFTNQRIVSAVLQLADQLGVRTIAEGIEQELQAELLKSLGCKLGQGYLYAKPMPAQEFRELLRIASDPFEIPTEVVEFQV
ncbi:MAG: EAL domain-containing protein, partial [Microthrixaceae bacterium]